MAAETKSKFPRSPIAVLTLSAAGFVGIVQDEGYSDKAIIPTKGDVPTLGFGTTGGVKMGDKITPAQAVVRAQRDITKFEGALKKCVRVPLYQGEYDAYTNLIYNIGPTAFCTNVKTGAEATIPRHLNAYDYEGGCKAILEYRYYKKTDCSQPNKVCAGLWTRRQELYQQCMEAING